MHCVARLTSVRDVARSLVSDWSGELQHKTLPVSLVKQWKEDYKFRYVRFYRSKQVDAVCVLLSFFLWLRRFTVVRSHALQIMTRLLARQIPGAELNADFLFERLRHFGAFKWYVMGGVVRDAVQGIETKKDLDVSLDLNFEKLKAYCDEQKPPIPCDVTSPHHFRIGLKSGAAYVEGLRNIQSATGDIEMHDFMINTLVYDVRRRP